VSISAHQTPSTLSPQTSSCTPCGLRLETREMPRRPPAPRHLPSLSLIHPFAQVKLYPSCRTSMRAQVSRAGNPFDQYCGQAIRRSVNPTDHRAYQVQYLEAPQSATVLPQEALMRTFANGASTFCGTHATKADTVYPRCGRERSGGSRAVEDDCAIRGECPHSRSTGAKHATSANAVSHASSYGAALPAVTTHTSSPTVDASSAQPTSATTASTLRSHPLIPEDGETSNQEPISSVTEAPDLTAERNDVDESIVLVARRHNQR